MRHLIFRVNNPKARIKPRFFYCPDLHPLNMINRIITVLGLFFLLLSTNILASDEYSDIQVIRSDEKGIVFRYKVPELTSIKQNRGDALFDILGIDKCPLSREPGYPQVPARIVVIGIPLEGEVDVRVLEENGLDGGKFNLPFFEERITGVDSKRKQIEISNEDIFYPERRVSFNSPTFMRNQRIIRLKIFPVQYNPLRKTVRYYSDITIAVDFSGEEKTEGRIEKDLFENVYRETLLNYEMAKRWRKIREIGLRKILQVDPFSYSDTWYKIILRENGVYKIDGNYLANAGINLSTIDPQKIRIFNGGGKVLPVLNSSSRPELRELAILVSDGGDNTFDPADYILFYGWSVNNWEYYSVSEEYKYYTNPYTWENVYWLTFSEGIPVFPDPPKRMETIDDSLLEPYPFISIKSKDRIHTESDVMLAESPDGIPYDYFNWYWNNGNSFTLYPSLANVFPGDTAVIRIKTRSGYADSITLNSITLSGAELLKSNYITSGRFTNLNSGLNTLRLHFPYQIYLDYYEIEYSKKDSCSNNQLLFENPDTSEVIEYLISGFNGTESYLFQIDDKFEVKRFVNFDRSADSVKFQDLSTEGEKKQYYLLDQTKFKTPLSINLDQMANLRDFSNQADLLVVTHSDFYDLLQGYEIFRKRQNQIKVKLIKAEDIYDEFSWGLFDPLAIRDFLKYAYENYAGQAPAYALLVGDGTYDYRNLLNTGSPSWIPPFAADGSVSDDNFVYFGEYGFLDEDSNGVVDMFIGRWPVKTPQDVQIIINKIRDYESAPEYDTWKNLITLVADDEFHPRGVNSRETEHTEYTDSLSKAFIPKSFNLNKIYLMEYPFDANKFKPEAEEAIINAINNGTVIVNYMGHGNPNVWADEYVFKREQDIPRLKNEKRLPLIYVASCSIGLFFNPYGEGMAEEFLRAEGKGAISVISATWLVYAWPNAQLNYKVYDLLLSPDSLSISEALYIAKLLRGYNSNDRQFIIIGDPLTIVASPKLQVELKDLSSDTLSALSLVNFKGEIVDGEGNIQTDFNGTAKLLAFDSERHRTHMLYNQYGDIVDSVEYNLPGNVIFRGNAQVQNGGFSGNFIVPKDIGYGGENARISAYVVNSDSSIDGAGALDSLIVAGTDTTVKDSLGPQINIAFVENQKFTDGDTVQPDPTLVVYITDSSGINLTGELGHGITLLIDDDWENIQDLTSYFQYDMNSYSQGSLTQKINLIQGEHSLKIKAWDNANNSSLESFQVKVLSTDKELSITRVMNYPNPFSRSTEFTYELSVPAEKVEIMIFTLSGRLIRTLTGTGSPGFNSGVVWNGRDQDGDKIANGVYIYKVIAEARYSSGGREVYKNAEAVGKAVVMN